MSMLDYDHDDDLTYDDDDDRKLTCEHADHLIPTVAQICQQVAWRGKEHIVYITY